MIAIRSSKRIKLAFSYFKKPHSDRGFFHPFQAGGCSSFNTGFSPGATNERDIVPSGLDSHSVNVPCTPLVKWGLRLRLRLA